jgi:pyridoxal phosphate enzyme (YggS family)
MAEFTLDEMRAHRDALENRIAAACAKCNRPRGSVTLIWVSKFHPLASVENALVLGAKEFGENRVQEAVEKFTEKRPGVRCHVIGPVQNNKLKKAALVADCIHSIESVDAVEKLESVCAAAGKTLDILFQVNTSEEATKSGVSMAGAEAFLNSLPEPKHLRYVGLMTIGKNTGVAEDSREGFAFLRNLRDKMHAQGGKFKDFTELSMGMTEDLDVAIEEGATMIRVGTALFGERDYNKPIAE